MLIYFKIFQDSHSPLRVSFLLTCTRQTQHSNAVAELYNVSQKQSLCGKNRQHYSCAPVFEESWQRNIVCLIVFFIHVGFNADPDPTLFLYLNTALDRIQGAKPFQINANPAPDPVSQFRILRSHKFLLFFEHF